MSEVYIRSQNKEKLYRLGGNYACVEYGLCGNRRGTGYRKEHTEALGYGHHKRAVSIIVGD